MKNSIWIMWLILVVGSMSGCATIVTPEPSKNITLEAAMTSVGSGLREMREAQGDKLSGLIPSEVDITFNISASSTDTARLELSNNAGLGQSMSTSNTVNNSSAEGAGTSSSTINRSSTATTSAVGKAELGTTLQGSRGNSVTVKFVNILTLDKSKLAWVDKDMKLKDFVKTWNDAGFATQSIGGIECNPKASIIENFKPKISE